MNALPQRIHIIGTPGAGKTTLARRLAQQFDMPFVELDALFWGPHWLPAESQVFRRRVRSAVRDPRWVACGNHLSARDLVWARADAVVWLDYPYRIGLSHLLRRGFDKVAINSRLWLRGQRAPAFSHDSLLLYGFRARQERRADFGTLLAQREFAHLKVLRFRQPEEKDLWLAGLADQSGLLDAAQSTTRQAPIRA